MSAGKRGGSRLTHAPHERIARNIQFSHRRGPPLTQSHRWHNPCNPTRKTVHTVQNVPAGTRQALIYARTAGARAGKSYIGSPNQRFPSLKQLLLRQTQKFLGLTQLFPGRTQLFSGRIQLFLGRTQLFLGQKLCWEGRQATDDGVHTRSTACPKPVGPRPPTPSPPSQSVRATPPRPRTPGPLGRPNGASEITG